MTALSREMSERCESPIETRVSWRNYLKDTVTIDDVARLAGVSPKTVSRVVNGEAHVSTRTKEAVDLAIASLGYRPNLAARSLAAARSFLVGVISPYLESFYFRKLHNGSIRACKERGLHVILEHVDLHDRDYLKHLDSGLRQLRFEGVILTPPIGDQAKILDLLEQLHIPYVRIGPMTYAERSDAVSADDAQGMRMLAEHFWSLGHRRFASAVVNVRRRDLFREALIEVGARPGDIQTMVLNWRETPRTIGRQIATELLALRKRPTAVWAFNDEVAAGLIGYAWEHGVRVPDDLSVVGCDDGEVAQAVWPTLTTIRQPLEEMSRAAVALLTESASRNEMRKVICPVELIVRGSTGAAAKKRDG
jgi:LacI family transcriptional regulator